MAILGLHGYCLMRFGLSRRPEGVRETAVAAQVRPPIRLGLCRWQEGVTWVINVLDLKCIRLIYDILLL